MKAVILAGGLGTRISEETALRPKPLIEVGGKPLLWHIMKTYSFHGVNDFIVCLGYKGYLIKEYFANFYLHASDVTVNLRTNDLRIHRTQSEPWTVTLVDTGERTMTGGRLKRVRDHIADETFCFTYGDGLSDVDVQASIAQHRSSQKRVTVTAVQPPGRYGALELDGAASVERFHEKPLGDGGWINGGYFVCEPSAIDAIAGDDTPWEQEPLMTLAAAGHVGAYRHSGFWQPVDTLRDKTQLEDLWGTGAAPWVKWR